MKPCHKIKPEGLMATKAVKEVFRILQGQGKEPQILFVGGCVRNALLEEVVSDIDLATKLSPQMVMAKLKAAGVKVIPTGLDHGTVTAVLNGESFQITTLRQDIDTDGRHAKVAYTDDWLADASRRDFTMNTLLADIKGNIFDLLGTGLRDLEKRKVVFVGNPKTRIGEDYLRILRFFRFHAWYGKGLPEAAGFRACVAASRNLKTLSKERITQEVLKIISSPRAGETLALMNGHSVLKSMFDSKFEEYHFKVLKKLDNINIETIGIVIIAGFSKSGAARVQKWLRLPNKQQHQIDETISCLNKFKIVSDHGLKVLLYKKGHDVAELVLLSRLLLDHAPSALIKKKISILREMDRPVLPMRGQDLLDQGMLPGPAIKKALDKFERFWISKGFKI